MYRQYIFDHMLHVVGRITEDNSLILPETALFLCDITGTVVMYVHVFDKAMF